MDRLHGRNNQRSFFHLLLYGKLALYIFLSLLDCPTREKRNGPILHVNMCVIWTLLEDGIVLKRGLQKLKQERDHIKHLLLIFHVKRKATTIREKKKGENKNKLLILLSSLHMEKCALVLCLTWNTFRKIHGPQYAWKTVLWRGNVCVCIVPIGSFFFACLVFVLGPIAANIKGNFISWIWSETCLRLNEYSSLCRNLWGECVVPIMCRLGMNEVIKRRL